eukprot:74342-Hanusia_phi.AAC.1
MQSAGANHWSGGELQPGWAYEPAVGAGNQFGYSRAGQSETTSFRGSLWDTGERSAAAAADLLPTDAVRRACRIRHGPEKALLLARLPACCLVLEVRQSHRGWERRHVTSRGDVDSWETVHTLTECKRNRRTSTFVAFLRRCCQERACGGRKVWQQ